MRTERFILGAPTTCTDGKRGQVVGLVIGLRDPSEGPDDTDMTKVSGYVLRYLVVEPAQRIAMGRLVPVTAAHPERSSVRLDCDGSRFEQFPAAEASRLLPGAERPSVFAGSWYSPAGMGANDIVPPGCVTLHAGAPIADGKLVGLVVDIEDAGRLVEFLVAKKRQWGRSDVVVVPVAAVVASLGKGDG